MMYWGLDKEISGSFSDYLVSRSAKPRIIWKLTWDFLVSASTPSKILFIPLVVICKRRESNLQLACRNRNGPGKTGSPFWMLVRVMYIFEVSIMSQQDFAFNSSAKYRVGGHFKEKASLQNNNTLTHQQIAVDNNRSHLQALFQMCQLSNPSAHGRHYCGE